MDGIYQWIRNITYYLIFITVVTNLLPNKKYEKYFKLFSGMVLILLVIGPLTKGLNLDDRLAYYFESISFQKQAGEFSREMTDMEGKRLEGMISQYEEAIEMDLKNMAESDGLVCTAVKASIDRDQESEHFGQVVEVELLLAEEGEEEAREANAVEGVTPVLVSIGEDTKGAMAQGEQEVIQENVKIEEKNQALGGLRKRIAEYYDLEEQDIEIQLEDRKR